MLCCISGGDTTALHNKMRDLRHHICPQALMLHGGVQPTCLYSALPPCWTGSLLGACSHKALALDLAVIKALGPSHPADGEIRRQAPPCTTLAKRGALSLRRAGHRNRWQVERRNCYFPPSSQHCKNACAFACACFGGRLCRCPRQPSFPSTFLCSKEAAARE